MPGSNPGPAESWVTHRAGPSFKTMIKRTKIKFERKTNLRVDLKIQKVGY
jgi:hypothetical protein